MNLDQDNANACCQLAKGAAMPDVLTQWHTQTSDAALSGDVAFVRGCESQAFDVTIGRSYQDRGIRNDCHDFFGVTITVPLFPISQDKKVRQVIGIEKLSVDDAAKDSEMNSASVSQPSVRRTASVSQPSVRDVASAVAQEDSEMKNTASVSQRSVDDKNTAGVSQPSVGDSASGALAGR